MEYKNDLTWSEFERIDMRVGTIVEARIFEKARRPAYQLIVDFGPLGTRKTSAQITDLYTPETLIGQQVIAVINFPPKQIANFMSECLVMGSYGPDKAVTLLQPERPTENGAKVG